MDADIDNSSADDQQQSIIASDERHLILMDLDTAATSNGEVASPPASSLHVRDPTISCVCPPGTQRPAEELIMTVTKEKGVTWLHRPCMLFSINGNLLGGIEGPAVDRTADDTIIEDAPGEGTMVNNGGNGSVGAFSALLGPSPSAKMLTKVKNFTTIFVCDCAGKQSNKSLEDYSLCKKCVSWQHNECILYGQEGDRGGPVCNHCYMEFLDHYEEIDRWQRRRLMEAVQEAVMFMTDPDTSHEVWRREWCKKFIRRFFAANKGLFVRFVTERRRAHQIARRMGIYDPAYRYFPRSNFVKHQFPEMDLKKEDVEGGARRHRRSISLASTDNIIVHNPGTKIATKAGRPKPRIRKRSPDRADGSKRSHKKKPEGTVSRKRQAKDKKQPRKKQRRLSPPSPVESEESSPPSASEQGERSPSPIRTRKGRGKSQLIGAGTARKPVRLSKAMKKPSYLIESEDDDVGDEDDDEQDNYDESPSPVRIRKGRGKSQLIGARAARKSVPMSEVMRRPAYLIESEDNDVEEEDDDEQENYDEEEKYDEEENYDEQTEDEIKREEDEDYEPKAAETVEYAENPEEDQLHALLNEVMSARDHRGSSPTDAVGRTGRENRCGCDGIEAVNGPSSICEDCGMHQHVACAASGRHARRLICNFCYESSRRLAEQTPNARRSISEDLPEVKTSNADRPLEDDILDEVHQLCSGILWMEYVSLPSPNEDDDKGATASPQTPPPDWLDECKSRFTSMLIAAGPEQTKAYLEPILKTSPRQPDPVVKSLTEMAIWMRRKGPWRQKRDAFGLLGEILGLYEKGAYWSPGGFL